MEVLAWQPLPARDDPDELFQVSDTLKGVSSRSRRSARFPTPSEPSVMLLAQKDSWRNGGCESLHTVSSSPGMLPNLT
jgi:hypothetical protein